MSRLKIITDSTADLSADEALKYDIDILPMSLEYQGQRYLMTPDFKGPTTTDLYQAMRRGESVITGLVSGEDIATHFRVWLDLGYDILYLACSSRLSGSLNNAMIVATEFFDGYPSQRILCLDTLRSNYAQGMLAIEASRQARAGKPIKDIVRWLYENRLRYQTFALSDSIDRLRKSGRLHFRSAFFDNHRLFKPIVYSDENGNNTVLKKATGRKNALDDLIDYVQERIEKSPDNLIMIEHADCPDDALYLKEQLKSRLKPADIQVRSLGHIVGATLGADGVSISFFGKKTTGKEK